MRSRTESLADELKRVIRYAGKRPEELAGKLPTLSGLHRVAELGADADEEMRLHFVLDRLIPEYSQRLPSGPDARAIRELLAWNDVDGQAQTLSARYHQASAHLFINSGDFGRRQEPKLMLECARYFIKFDYDDRTDAAGEAVRADDTSVGPNASTMQSAEPTAGIVNVHRRLDPYRLATELRGAKDILILNTWIPALEMFAFELADALSNGAHVRILMLHPYSQAARLSAVALRNAQSPFRKDTVKLGVGHCLDVLGSIATELDDDSRSRLQVRLYDSLPSIAVYSVDGRAMVSVFMHGKLADNSPQIEVHDYESWIGQSVAEEIRTLWDMAQPVTGITSWKDEIGLIQPSPQA